MKISKVKNVSIQPEGSRMCVPYNLSFFFSASAIEFVKASGFAETVGLTYSSECTVIEALTQCALSLESIQIVHPTFKKCIDLKMMFEEEDETEEWIKRNERIASGEIKEFDEFNNKSLISIYFVSCGFQANHRISIIETTGLAFILNPATEKILYFDSIEMALSSIDEMWGISTLVQSGYTVALPLPTKNFPYIKDIIDNIYSEEEVNLLSIGNDEIEYEEIKD